MFEPLFVSARPEVAALQETIIDQLMRDVILDFPYLLEAKTAGEQTVRQLTYSGIVHRETGGDSPDLPESFEPYEEPEANCLLMKGHLDRIRSALDRRQISISDFDQPIELGGFVVRKLGAIDVPFMQANQGPLMNTIDGYDWRRGHLVEVDDANQVLLLEPWVNIYMKGGAPFPMLYASGKPGRTDVIGIVEDYNSLTNHR